MEHLALLKRAMRFSTVSANDIVARAVSVVISIFLAWRGWGYWALVAQVIAVPLSTSIGAWTLCRWLPAFPRRAANTPAMVRFAMHVYGRFTVNYFSRNTDNLLVGWRFNAQALGFYKKAYDLFALSAGLLVSPLANVAIAALSRFNPRSAEFRRHMETPLPFSHLWGWVWAQISPGGQRWNSPAVGNRVGGVGPDFRCLRPERRNHDASSSPTGGSICPSEERIAGSLGESQSWLSPFCCFWCACAGARLELL